MDTSGKSILVIEDEPLLLKSIEKMLSSEDFDVTGVTNAKDAIVSLEESEKLPDAIWLDYYLPDMNGLEFMSSLKENEKWKNIPVIVVSNSASSKKVKSMLSLGAKEYLLKAEHRLDDIVSQVKDIITSSK